MQEISCVLCQTSQSAPIISENGFTGRQCAECGLIFVSPRPTRQEIEEIYEQGEAYLSADFFVQGPGALVSVLRARRDAKLTQRHASGGSVLEIGPGRGTFLVAARQRGFQVFGVELTPPRPPSSATTKASRAPSHSMRRRNCGPGTSMSSTTAT